MAQLLNKSYGFDDSGIVEKILLIIFRKNICTESLVSQLANFVGKTEFWITVVDTGHSMTSVRVVKN